MLRAKTAERRCGSVLWRLEIQGGRLMEIQALAFSQKNGWIFLSNGGCVLRGDTVKAKGFTKGSFCGVF